VSYECEDCGCVGDGNGIRCACGSELCGGCFFRQQGMCEVCLDLDDEDGE